MTAAVRALAGAAPTHRPHAPYRADRPLGHVRHDLPPADGVTDAVAPFPSRSALNRSQLMQLMHEDLARAHYLARSQEAQRAARVHRLVAARRAQRRAEAAALRARRLLATAAVW
jgi:hypothetical protein